MAITCGGSRRFLQHRVTKKITNISLTWLKRFVKVNKALFFKSKKCFLVKSLKEKEKFIVSVLRFGFGRQDCEMTKSKI